MDFDLMREQLYSLPASPSIRHARLWLFDMYRYEEEYEKLFQLMEDLT